MSAGRGRAALDRAGADRPTGLVLSCEHGGARVPRPARPWLDTAAARRALASHRGQDRGALATARSLARRLDVPLIATTVSRLAVDANRSLHHPRLHSEWLRDAPPGLRAALVERHWRPHRERVERAAREAFAERGRVLHVGIHSFAARLGGRERRADVALLYDPARRAERRLAAGWLAALAERRPDLRLRRNFPYRGTADGLTTTLRRTLGRRYLGLELELAVPLATRPGSRPALVDALASSLLAAGDADRG